MSMKHWIAVCKANGVDPSRLSPHELYFTAGKLMQNKKPAQRGTPQWMREQASAILKEFGNNVQGQNPTQGEGDIHGK